MAINYCKPSNFLNAMTALLDTGTGSLEQGNGRKGIGRGDIFFLLCCLIFKSLATLPLNCHPGWMERRG